MAADATVEIIRNESRRLRVGQVDVTLRPTVDADDASFQGCLDKFEDFCVVTQSVRQGIDVNVQVEPRSA